MHFCQRIIKKLLTAPVVRINVMVYLLRNHKNNYYLTFAYVQIEWNRMQWRFVHSD